MGLTLNGKKVLDRTLLHAQEFILDADGDSSLTADADDQLDLRLGGTDIYVFKTTGLDIGAVTNAILVSGATTSAFKIDADATTGFELTSNCSPTNALLVSGTTTSAIKIDADATTALEITSNCTPTDGIIIAGSTARGINISGAASSAQLYIGGTDILANGEQAIYVNCPSEDGATNAAWFTLGSTVTSGDVTGLRSRVTGNAASGGANIRGAYSEAFCGASKHVATLQGLLAHASVAAGTCTVATTQVIYGIFGTGDSFTGTDVYVGYLKAQTRGTETIGGNYCLLGLENEAVGGVGKQMDSAIRILATNVSTPYAFGYGIDLSGAAGEIATADIRLSNGETIANITDGIIDINGNIAQANGQYISCDEIRARDGDGLKLYDDGGNGIFVEKGGNVGIGTTTPTRMFSVDLTGTASIEAAKFINSTSVLVEMVNTTQNFSGVFGLTTAAFRFDGQGQAAATAAPIQFMMNNSVKLHIATGGNVGIGTTAPQSLLDVQGAAGAAGILTLATKELTVVDGDVLGRINFNAPLESSGTDAILVGASIAAVAEGEFTNISNATELIFYTGASEAATQKMVITSAGLVGIGTVGPAATLHVSRVSAVDHARLHIDAGVDKNPYLQWMENGVQKWEALNNHGDDSLRFRNGSYDNILVLQEGGNVGIGATAPGSLLEVRAAAAAAGTLTLSTAELTVVDGDILGRIDFQAPLEDSGTDAILVGASIWAEADDTFAANNNATELVFATGASEAATEKVRITSDGKMGVGAAVPTASLDINSDILRLRTPKTPASTDAAGNQGDICWDSSYIYVCTATNFWERALIQNWE